MRLLKFDEHGELCLTSHLHDEIPPYAILSHTWGKDHEEVTFEDLRNGAGKSKPGYAKLLFCGQQARRDELEYFWVDTCCINKDSDAELSEAINSMFRWYRSAEKCYVYLSDVSSRKRDIEGHWQGSWKSSFRTSRWFTRGWTLQELLAPASVEFFSREEDILGSKATLEQLIREITSIPVAVLRGARLADFSVSERMRWAAKRSTKKIEDKVYCLLGIFNVFMSPLYGEGEHALARLKDEIGKSYRSQLDGIEHTLRPSDSFGPASRGADPLSTSVMELSIQDRRKELISSLSFEQMDSRRSTIKSAYSSTCKWLLKHDAYVDWLNPNSLPQHLGFLWINGKPGAGKSTLVKFAHAQAEKHKTQDDLVVSFFFNARGDEFEKSTVGMYRALLFQLFTKATDLQEVLDNFFPSSNDASQYPQWTIEILRELFIAVVASLGQRKVTCFIDALDECEEQQIQEMVFFFEELGQEALEQSHQFYICFASRHYPTIDIREGPWQLTLEHEDGHSEDLAKYVQNHLRAGKRKDIDEIRQDIQEKANGVFMWAVLVVDILNKEFRTGRIFAVKKRLQEIPPKLSDLFKDILRRDCANMADLLLCLQWLLFTKRPLRREEFYYAMVAGLGPESQYLDEWDPETTTIDDMNRFVYSSSKGLAELTKSKIPTVQFIHESVRDFLIKDRGLRELWPEIDEAMYSLSHERLKQCCQDYLHVDLSSYLLTDTSLPKASSSAAKDLRHEITIKFPFLEYANHNVLYHADEAATKTSQDEFLANFPLRNWLSVANLLERFDIRRHSLDASLLYLCAENNFSRLIHAIRPLYPTIHIKGERYQYPLFAALANGHRDAVKALLHHDGNSQLENVIASLEFGPAFSARKRETPLLWAISHGHQALIDILLASESSLEWISTEGKKALFVAAKEGNERVVNLLVESHKINIDSTDKRGRTPLSHAAEQGHISMVQLLLKKGTHIEAVDNADETALMWAAKSGRDVVIHLLLDKGADTEAKDNFKKTALMYAAQMGQEKAVQLLLDKGADIEAKDYREQTPLMRATDMGKEKAVQLLLGKGADIEAKDDKEQTPLMYAAEMGLEKAVQLLLDKGADIEAKDNKERTPLMRATERGIETTVRLLLDRGANIEAKSHVGLTPLCIAARDGNGRLVHLLYSRGANTEARDKDGRTPLSYACLKGNQQTLQMLLSYNTDVVNAADRNGKSALWRAMEGDPWCGGLQSFEEHSSLAADQMQEMPQEQRLDENLALSSRQSRHLSSNRLEIVRLLLENGASPDATLPDGKSALMLAARWGCEDAVRLLLHWNADINAADMRGMTASAWAVEGGHIAVAELLQTEGAKRESELKIA